MIRSYYPGIIIILNTISNQGPCFAIVISLIEIGGVIPKLIGRGRNINGSFVERTRIYGVDHV